MKTLLKIFLRPGSRIAAAIIVFCIAVLAMLFFMGYMDPAIKYLDSPEMTFAFGDMKISAYKLVVRAISVLMLLWIANYFSRVGQDYLGRIHSIRSSNKALVIKTFQIALYVVIFFVVLNILNINLATLAVLGGAIGIGIGFGLQKIASNFISGLILLFEKSVNEGDLVELGGGITGNVKNTGFRYTLIQTGDGKEVMVPNENFITERVTNATFTDARGRLEIKVGVSYNSDVEKARELILEAAYENSRCLRDPLPSCFLTDFGENAINFMLYFWVDNVLDGRAEPKSEVMFAILRKFKQNGIEIPFPQMDLNFKNYPPAKK
ncbi:MAG: mechanosensitive ion channel [Rickettsiaceae bacterium]|jgi:small-conductance mechanosensitive channel|nr:mechanosensitive ion channel [Rickettsiaceae bacterium]